MSAVAIKNKSPEQWQSYIGTALKKTAEATLDTAKRLAEYRASVEEDVYQTTLKEWYNFSPSHLSYWAKIAENLPRLEQHIDCIPGSPRALYELSNMSDQLWSEFVQTGDITPSLTVEGIKALKTRGGFKETVASKYSEADNYLEIMQQISALQEQHANDISKVKEAFEKWIKANPPQYPEEVIEEPVKEKPESKVVEVLPKTTTHARVQALAAFGIFTDKPIVDKEILTFLDKLAGNKENLLHAIEVLENE